MATALKHQQPFYCRVVGDKTIQFTRNWWDRLKVVCWTSYITSTQPTSPPRSLLRNKVSILKGLDFINKRYSSKTYLLPLCLAEVYTCPFAPWCSNIPQYPVYPPQNPQMIKCFSALPRCFVLLFRLKTCKSFDISLRCLCNKFTPCLNDSKRLGSNLRLFIGKKKLCQLASKPRLISEHLVLMYLYVCRKYRVT